MAPKRKSDAVELADAEEPEIIVLDGAPTSSAATKSHVETDDAPAGAPAPKAKRGKAAQPKPKLNWWEVKLEGEDEGDVPIYDDCNDIRRKTRHLLQAPGFKITSWLEQIGGINNNSYQRFMRATGPTGGASNGLYYCAYKYFEKVRIAEGKKKTAKRLQAEAEHYGGMPMENRRRMWVFTGR